MATAVYQTEIGKLLEDWRARLAVGSRPLHEPGARSVPTVTATRPALPQFATHGALQAGRVGALSASPSSGLGPLLVGFAVDLAGHLADGSGKGHRSSRRPDPLLRCGRYAPS
jgi:hypothetical protein